MAVESGTCFFLGANTPIGFYPLFDELIRPDRLDTVFLLKGGPGCGKSTLMHKVAHTLAGHGLEIEYIRCSGDPDSLDAIHIPAIRAAIADATAPHALEPKCPGAVERYVDLGQCYDFDALHSMKDRVLAATADYRSCHDRATRCINASAQVQQDARMLLTSPALEAKLIKRAKGILSREVKKCGTQPGHIEKRFLDSPTWKGFLGYFQTAELLCRRIYELSDSWGLADPLLDHLAAGIVAAGYNVILCPDPLNPERSKHLLVPSLSLGFLTASPALPYEKRPYRMIRVDNMVDPDLLKLNRSRLKFSRRIAEALMAEAVASLEQARIKHDALEAIYNPHVNFAAVHHIADDIAEELLCQAFPIGF